MMKNDETRRGAAGNGDLMTNSNIAHNPLNGNERAQAAQELYSLGYSIIPLRAGQKVPTERGWTAETYRPTPDAWSGNPAPNLGIRTGDAGLVVIDLDTKGDTDGIANWQALCRKQLLETLPDGRIHQNQVSAETPSGGVHLYFRAVASIGNSAGRLADGIDVRGRGGQVAAPPSATATGVYSWIVSPTAQDAHIPQLPQWIIDALSTPERSKATDLEQLAGAARRDLDASAAESGALRRYVNAAVASAIETVSTAREGSRNDTLNAAAYSLGQFVASGWSGVDRATIEGELERAARQCGLSDHEASATIRSGLAAGAQKPRPMPDLRSVGDGSSAHGDPWGEVRAMMAEREEQAQQPDPRATQRGSVRDDAPWRNVTASQIWRAIEGTALEPLVRLFEAPMVPSLPLEVTLPRAIVAAGCALCGRGEATAFQSAVSRGIDLARLKIATGGGQASNVYALIVGLSGGGKDIGGLMDRLALQNGWMVGNSGSAEGLAETLAMEEKGNGYIAISEFSSWLDKAGWQAKAAAFLTDAFNRGWFSVRLSSRNNAVPRESKYCYPSIMANIQPESLARYAQKIDIANGFLSRFLIGRLPDDYISRPITGDALEPLFADAQAALDCYQAKAGTVTVPGNYLSETFDAFWRHKAEFRGHWTRLVNEYGPRFAVMLSVGIGDDSPTVKLTDKAWRGAALMVQWFYAMGEAALSEIRDDERTARRETIIRRIHQIIRDNGPCRRGLVSQYTKMDSTKEERNLALEELIDRGLIVYDGSYYRTIVQARKLES